MARRGGRNQGSVRVEIQGLAELRDAIEGLEVPIRAACFRALKESAEAVVADTAANVRKDSGNLQKSVKARYENNRLRAEVGWWDQDDDYAQYHEFGTRKIPAKPSLGPALEQERNKIGDRVAVEVKKVLPR